MSLESQPAQPLALPLLRGRYELGERVGEGTFFFTHRGRDTETGRTVAIRVLRPELAAEEAFVSRLLSETQAVISLRHPNIGQISDVWRERGTLIIVAEWVRGISLKDRIRRVAPFPMPVAMDIALACAEALHYAHKSGFVHGDVRPENIIITPDGRVKLTDFGVGAGMASSSRIQLGALSDAAYYLSPEVAQGRPPDARSDLYSLGCILFEMLSGEVPFDGDTPLAVAVRHLHDAPPSLRRESPAIPEAVDGLTQKCLQKDPMRRYVTAEGLLQDIHAVRDALRHDRPLNWSPLRPAAEESTPVPQKRKPAPSRPARRPPEEVDTGPSVRVLALLGVFILLLVGGFFGIAVVMTQAPNQITVPAGLVRQPEAEAVSTLKELGLVPDVRRDHNDRVPAGLVFETAPRGGTDIRVGRTVVVYVSQGRQPVRTPDVIGQALGAARKQLQAAGLVLGETREEFSEVIPAGEVLSQTPVGGTETPRQSPVNLVVSKGREPIPAPQDVQVDTAPLEPPPADTLPPEPVGDLTAREHVVTFQVPPRNSGPQRVRIMVRNADGTEETAYEQEHSPGDTVDQTVVTLGPREKCQIRVYLNGQLIHRQGV